MEAPKKLLISSQKKPVLILWKTENPKQKASKAPKTKIYYTFPKKVMNNFF